MQQSSDLDLATSLQMAKVAYGVYGRRPSPLAEKTRVTARLTEVSEFTTRRMRCCAGYWRSGSRASIVVAFRGSSNGSEWMNNAHPGEWCSISPTVAGRVHPGFIYSLTEVWDDLADAVRRLCQAHLPEMLAGYAAGKSVPLCFTGHSRGGAVALLAGLRSLTEFILPVRVYTFGAPRVGDIEFAQGCMETFRQGESGHWRFECQGDPVPVLPFALQGTHTGSLVYLRPGSRTVDIVGDEQHAGRRLLRTVSMRPSQHHKMATYLNRLSFAVTVQTVPALTSVRA